MEKTITKKQKRYMMNPIVQFFRFIYLNLKIMRIVAGGHGGTRKKAE
jgi:hypothetical protein